MALLDMQVAMLANQASNYLVGGKTPKRMGNAHSNIVPYQVFATRDGHMVLAIGNDGQFPRFCQLAGHPEVGRDPRYATNATALRGRAELVAHDRGLDANSTPPRNGWRCWSRTRCPARRSSTCPQCSSIRRCGSAGMQHRR